jgi:hypothetical protein
MFYFPNVLRDILWLGLSGDARFWLPRDFLYKKNPFMPDATNSTPIHISINPIILVSASMPVGPRSLVILVELLRTSQHIMTVIRMPSPTTAYPPSLKRKLSFSEI